VWEYLRTLSESVRQAVVEGLSMELRELYGEKWETWEREGVVVGGVGGVVVGGVVVGGVGGVVVGGVGVGGGGGGADEDVDGGGSDIDLVRYMKYDIRFMIYDFSFLIYDF
jgi:hypothetical protein